MANRDFLYFSFDPHLGAPVASALGVPMGDYEETVFEDGEHRMRVQQPVSGRHCVVLDSLYAEATLSADRKLLRMAFFIGALKAAGARRVSAVAPYLCYSRKDRRAQVGDPIITRHLAQILEAVGCDQILTVDVHNLASFENAFRIPADNIEGQALFVDHLVSRLANQQAVVVSPDAGGIKRSETFRRVLEQALGRPVERAMMEKLRGPDGVRGDLLVGPIEGRVAVLVDDLINTGSTLARAARACRQHGASAVYALATHGLFVDPASDTLASADISELVVTTTVPAFRLRGAAAAKLVQLDCSALLAAAIEYHCQGR
ncbi:MAG: ribose-phosphate pyrophosphokinase [Xanthomonadales bacterium]|nr:ribose-phosphate pyrophosphokinase [Xanthomonadales bacterium]